MKNSESRGHWFESPLEQFLLKTRAVNSVLGNRKMIRKILTWWKNSVHGNRKTARKNSAVVGNFPQLEKRSLPLHRSFSTAAPVLYGEIYLPPFSLSVVEEELSILGKERRKTREILVLGEGRVEFS